MMSMLSKLLDNDLIACEIIKVLGLRECLLSFSMINKIYLKKFMNNIIIHKMIKNGILCEMSGRLLFEMINQLRIICYQSNNLQISNESQIFLKNNDNHTFLMSTSNSKKLQIDAMKMNAGIYTYWFGFPSTPNEGVFSDLCETRVHGIFYVYMDRPDGTILISEDFMHVYLVQGITKSIGQMFLKKLNKEVEKKKNNTTMKIVPSYSELEFHRPTVNVRMIATLLPWQGKIAYDGLGVIDSSKVTTDQRILIALKRAYINAVDKEKIIYSLKKNDQTLYIPSTKFSSSQLNVS